MAAAFDFVRSIVITFGAMTFVHHPIKDDRSLRLLTLIDEHNREYFSIDMDRKLNRDRVLDRLTPLFLTRGITVYIRSNSGPEFTSRRVREWSKEVVLKTLFIEPGSPWENGSIESFNGKLRDELSNLEIFDTLQEALVMIEPCRRPLQPGTFSQFVRLLASGL